jgi:hypothetical protein
MSLLSHSTVKNVLLSISLAVSFVSTGAQAQYYYQQTPRYYPAPQYRPQPYPPGYGEEVYVQRPRRAAGSVCVTSRGECSVRRYVPLGTGCACNIPGFGRKRGHVQY